MGYHHYERRSATRMMIFISDEMHKTFIRAVCEKSLPISIIIDAATDASQNHYLIILFQHLENEIPVIYFYTLVKLTADESAAGLFRSIQEQFDVDGLAFKNAIKRDLVGFASDGAAVMMGSQGGLKVNIVDYVKQTITYINLLLKKFVLRTYSIISVCTCSVFNLRFTLIIGQKNTFTLFIAWNIG